MTASYFTGGYGQSDLMTETSDPTYIALPGGFFDRSAAANPFKDYSYVYVPYCTGDAHAGDNVATLGTHSAHFVGFANVAAYLKRIVPTFAKADRVILAGSSAGGLGAAYNWWQTQEAFGKVRVDLIDDSGTPMPADIPSPNVSVSAAAWNLDAHFPPGCSACKASYDALLPFYAKSFPGQRAALLSYVQDSVLPSYYGVTEAEFEMGLQEVITKDIDPTPTFKVFTNPASGHVLWFSPALTTSGVTVQQFVTQMVTDAPAWASVQ